MLVEIEQDIPNNRLLVSYWGKDNKTHIHQVNIPDELMFNYTTTEPKFVPDGLSIDAENVADWDGKKVYKSYFSKTPSKKTGKIYGFHQSRLYDVLDDVLTDEEKEKIFCSSSPEIYFCDIETDIPEDNSFPTPVKAEMPITCIGLSMPNDLIMVLGIGKLNDTQISNIQSRINDHFKEVNRQFKFKYVYFPTEAQMMTLFLKMVSKMPVLTGWNFEDFDWRYIVKRCENIGVDVNLSSPTRNTCQFFIRDVNPDLKNQERKITLRPYHVPVFDYLNAYKFWSYKKPENFRLDNIGEDEVGIRKVEYKGSLRELYYNDLEKYIFYNAIDCGLVRLIHEKTKCLTAGMMQAWMTKTSVMKIFSKTALAENCMRMEFKKENKIITRKVKEDNTDSGKYEGAFVKEPIKGYKKIVDCHDFASLYPTVMRQYNIGPDTYLGKLDPESDKEKINKLRKDDRVIVTKNGTVFKREDGHLKKILTDFYGQRKKFKKDMFKWKQAYFDAETLLNRDSSDEEVEEFLKNHEIE